MKNIKIQKPQNIHTRKLGDITIFYEVNVENKTKLEPINILKYSYNKNEK